MPIKKSDYIDWLDNPVTQEAAKDVAQRVEQEIGNLVRSRDNTPIQDAWIKGLITGVQALLDWDPEFIEEEIDAEN